MTKLQEIRKKSDKMLNIQKNGIHLQTKRFTREGDTYAGKAQNRESYENANPNRRMNLISLYNAFFYFYFYFTR